MRKWWELKVWSRAYQGSFVFYEFILQLLLIVFHIFVCVFNLQEKKKQNRPVFILCSLDHTSWICNFSSSLDQSSIVKDGYLYVESHSQKLVTGPGSSSRSWWARFELVFLWLQDVRVWCSEPTGVKRKHYE